MKLNEIEAISKWLNEWGDYNKHPEVSANEKRTQFGDGYQQAIKDIFERFKIFEEKLRLSHKKWQRWSEEDEKRLIEMYDNGYPYVEIAKDLSRSLASTSGRIDWLCQQGIIQKNRSKVRE